MLFVTRIILGGTRVVLTILNIGCRLLVSLYIHDTSLKSITCLVTTNTSWLYVLVLKILGGIATLCRKVIILVLHTCEKVLERALLSSWWRRFVCGSGILIKDRWGPLIKCLICRSLLLHLQLLLLSYLLRRQLLAVAWSYRVRCLVLLLPTKHRLAQ